MRNPYRYVIRALPPEYRRAHGSELIDTALDLRGGKWSMREALLLLTHGLRSRAFAATKGSRRQAVGQAIVTTIEFIAIGLVSTMTAWLFLIDGPFATYETKAWMIPLLVLTAAALLSGRVAMLVVAAAVLTFVAQFGVRWPYSSRFEFATAITLQAVVIALAGLWALRNTSAELHPRRSAMLVVLLSGIGTGFGPETLGIALFIALLVGAGVGLLIAAWDPRLLLLAVCAVVWNRVVTLPFLASGPFAPGLVFALVITSATLCVVLLISALALRRLRTEI